jgi:hypothetical protein
LKRIIMIGTAIAVLVGAAAAYAALNTYTATLKFQSSGAGTAKAPKPIGYTETLTASNAIPADRAAPLIDIKTTIYGLTSDAKAFPSCSFKTIDTGPKFDAACPAKAKVGGGQVSSLLGSNVLSTPGSPCNPGLDVWNGGGNKLWFFFTAVGTQCGALRTGSTAPYPGTIKQAGKNLVIDVPLPPFVSTAVANQTGLYGSLIKEVLNFPKDTIKAKGKTVGFLSSIACKGKNRPYSVAFTATNGTTKETKTISKTGSC